jgi:hypothetical protein
VKNIDSSAFWSALGLILLSLALPMVTPAQQEVEFSGHTWEVNGDMKVQEHLGRTALMARNGFALLKGTPFRDGIVEFDVAMAGPRSFAGVAFRVDSATGTYEDFYLRPHNTDRFDAMQYTPVFHNLTAWQLYPEYNASSSIPRDQWIHVRMVIAGSDLKVYLHEADEPALHVPHLRGSPVAGAIALKAFFPGASGTDLYPNAYSNLSVTPAQEEAALVPETLPARDSGMVTHWSVAPSMPAPQSGADKLPAMPGQEADWETAATDETGRLNLARYRSFPEGARRGAVMARVVIHAESPQTRRLNLGFSDQVTIFLNGRPLFDGNNTYRTRSPKYLGVMTLDHQALHVDLRKGSNELIFLVSESFGGWGITARLDSLEGLRLEP